MKVVLEKYHGLGNDYLVFDPNKNTLKLSQENVKLIRDRHFGIGSDGILEGPILEKEKMEVRVQNPDSSIAEKSDNGVRIFAKYLKDAGYAQETHVALSILAGDVDVQCLNEEGARMKASTGKVSFWSDGISVNGERREVVNKTMIFEKIPYCVTCATVGSPYYVIFLNEMSKDIIYRIGESSENVSYFPERVNTQVMRVTDRQNIEIEIYEHGIGYTLASGSSDCATTVAAYKQGLTDSKVHVRMPGGALEIEVLDDWTVLMTGNVSFMGTMRLNSALVEQLQALE